MPIVSLPEYIRRIAGISGDAGPFETWQILNADSTPNTTTSMFDANALIMTTIGLDPGTWHYRYIVKYQTAAATTGIGMRVGHTGTNAFWNGWLTQLCTSPTAANGIGDNLHSGGPPGIIGNIMEGYAVNASAAVTGFTVGTTGPTSTQAILEGVFNVSVLGNLEFRIASEIAGSGVHCINGTILELKRIASD